MITIVFRRTCTALAAWLCLLTAPVAAVELFAAGNVTQAVTRHDPLTGALLGTFASGFGAGPTGLAIDAASNRLFVGLNDHRLLAYDLASGRLLNAWSLAAGIMTMGPDGNLYVADFFADRVYRIGPSIRAPALFLPLASRNLNGPTGLAFHDGSLYVSSRISGEVLRYDQTTGAYQGVFVTPGGNGPQQLTFGPDGNLYVPNPSCACVQRFNGSTGAFLGRFASTSGTGDGATASFGPDGSLYVSSLFDGDIQVFDPHTGLLQRRIQVNYGVTQYAFYTPVPEPAAWLTLLAGLVLLSAASRASRRHAATAQG